MIGAGFGGCAMTRVAAGTAEPLVTDVTAGYEKRFALMPHARCDSRHRRSGPRNVRFIERRPDRRGSLQAAISFGGGFDLGINDKFCRSLMK